MKLKKSEIPKNLPLRRQVSGEDFIGAGKDNAVFQLQLIGGAAVKALAPDYVVKVNHRFSATEAARLSKNAADRIIAENGIKYKKNKYEVLKHFLGDFIPNSKFALGQEGEGDKKRYVELTLQERVPQVKLSDLSPEQQASPMLKENLHTLMERLQYMYRVLGEANARSGQGSHLDAKLDLGGVSDAVRTEQLDHNFDDSEVEHIISTNKSPNMLVDPKTMRVYCIDFDQGQWSPGMAETMQLAFDIDRRNRADQAAGGLGSIVTAPDMYLYKAS